MKILTKWEWKETDKYRAMLTANASIDLSMGYQGLHEFCSEDNVIRGILKNDRLTIMAGYSSDLCSPGYYIFGRWYGTPSKGAEIPAFLHDFARQFMRPNVKCSPWDRKGSDILFYNALTLVGFPLRSIYFKAVSGPIGNFWNALNRPRPNVYCGTNHK